MSVSEDISDLYRKFLVYRAGRSMKALNAADPEYNSIIEPMRRMLIGIAYTSIGSRFDESAADEKLMALFSLPDGHIAPEKFASYALRAIRMDYIDKYKHDKRYETLPDDTARSIAREPDQEVENAEELAAACRRLKRAFALALKGKDDKVMQSVIMKLEGKSYEEIAEILGDETPAVNMRVFRFFGKVMECYATDPSIEGHDLKQVMEDDLELLKFEKVSVLEVLGIQSRDVEEKSRSNSVHR
jgi:DNA-directed RNA polymerase specialized sigma24 family protein